MAVTERTELLPTADEKLGKILQIHRPLRFEETVGPQPGPGDAEDLEHFLAFLQEQRRGMARFPGDEEQP
jgi:hypothetical protein